LDYSKCLGISALTSASTENQKNTQDELNTTMYYSTFIKITAKEKLKNSKVKIFCLAKMKISSHCSIYGNTFRTVAKKIHFQTLLMVKYKMRTNL
jgi:hypothetical protein